MNNPWLALLDPDVITGGKKSPHLYLDQCVSPVMKYLGESTMLGFGLTGQSLSELPGGTPRGRLHDTKVKRSAGKRVEFIFLFGRFGETDDPVLSKRTLKSPARTCSVTSFSGLRHIGHWELFEAASSTAIKEFQPDEL